MFWIINLTNCLFLFHCLFLEFSLVFQLRVAPLPFHSFNFLCLCEFRWNWYLLWSWRLYLLILEHPYKDYVCPMPFVGELDLLSTQYLSSWCAGSYHLVRRWGWKLRAISGAGCETRCFLCSAAITACSAAITALWQWSLNPSCWAPLPLCVCFSFSLNQNPCPRGFSC